MWNTHYINLKCKRNQWTGIVCRFFFFLINCVIHSVHFIMLRFGLVSLADLSYQSSFYMHVTLKLVHVSHKCLSKALVGAIQGSVFAGVKIRDMKCLSWECRKHTQWNTAKRHMSNYSIIWLCLLTCWNYFYLLLFLQELTHVSISWAYAVWVPVLTWGHKALVESVLL